MEWELFSGGRDKCDAGGCFMYIGDEFYAGLYAGLDGAALTPVTVTEDPDGAYLGWMQFEYLHYKADTVPQMIQPHDVLFRCQFAYGPEAEVDRGRGRIVRLAIKERN